MKKRIVISVSNDLSTDQRVRKTCNSLINEGYDVYLIGRLRKNSPPLNREYKTLRMRLIFSKGALFYAELNLRLFLKILFLRTDLLWANDLDTLPANYFLSVLRKKKLVYDSHEYFTEVPEIQGRPFVKSTWRFFERWMISQAKNVITVNQSILELLEKEYNLNDVLVVRNLPDSKPRALEIDRAKIIGKFEYLLILQGSGINIDRGAEEMVQAMQYLGNMKLLFVGSGDAIPDLKRLVLEMDLSNQVSFYPRMAYSEMMAYTAISDLGLSLDKPKSINYQLSLPNKLFDYAICGIPVFASSLVEIEKIFETYPFGVTFKEHDPKKMADQIQLLLNDASKIEEMQSWANRASKELTWEKDFKSVLNSLNIE